VDYLSYTTKEVLYSNLYVWNILQTDESTIICMIFGLNKNTIQYNTIQYNTIQYNTMNFLFSWHNLYIWKAQRGYMLWLNLLTTIRPNYKTIIGQICSCIWETFTRYEEDVECLKCI
jgi:hypothetical protein